MLGRNQDAFGRALADFAAGDARCSMIERDDGYIEEDHLERYFGTFPSWPALQRKAIARAKGRVLDVGCGAGQHSLYLQGKGHRVVGIDQSPLAVRVCRQRGLRDARAIGVAEIPPDLGPFDTILMLGNNLGLLGGARRGRWLLKRFAGLAAEDGIIVGETMDPRLTTNPAHKRYQRLSRRRGRLPAQARLRARYKDLATPWFDYLFVSPAELRGILTGTGWRIGELIRSDGPGFVAVLQKRG